MQETQQDELDYETVSVEQIYTEELEALEGHYSLLRSLETEAADTVADSLEHVINYFRIRLGMVDDEDLTTAYGVASDTTTLH